jgi:integrase
LKLTVSDLHGFRRFFATEMMRAGVDAESVRQWGGWKSLETMLRYLADVREGDSVLMMEKAAAKLAVS